MSNKIERRVSECQGKDRFLSYTQAKSTVSEKLRHKVEAYHCVSCGGWHIGGNQSARHKRMLVKKVKEAKRV